VKNVATLQLPRNLFRHIRGVHQNKKDYISADCGHEFTQYGNLKIHMKVHRKTYFCDRCRVAFHKKSEVDEHLKTAHADEDVKSLKSEEAKNAEMEREHGDLEQTQIAMNATPDAYKEDIENEVGGEDPKFERPDTVGQVKLEVKVDLDAFSQIIEQVDEQQDEMKLLVAPNNTICTR